MYVCDDLSAASRASAGTSRTKMHTAFIPRRTKIRCLPRRLPPKTIIRPGKTRMKVRRCFMRGRTERPGRPTPSGRKGMAGGQGAERASQLLCNVPFASIAPLSTQVISGHNNLVSVCWFTVGPPYALREERHDTGTWHGTRLCSLGRRIICIHFASLKSSNFGAQIILFRCVGSLWGRPTPSERKGMTLGHGTAHVSAALGDVLFASISPVLNQVISGHK